MRQDLRGTHQQRRCPALALAPRAAATDARGDVMHAMGVPLFHAISDLQIPLVRRSSHPSPTHHVKPSIYMISSSNKRKSSHLGRGGSPGGSSGEHPVSRHCKDPPKSSRERGMYHLPAPIWGHILDYMAYEEVLSALLVCKMLVKEAVQYVLALTFTKACQMDVPSARRFPNVEKVRILCLISGPREKWTICKTSSLRLVPFLTTFPKLKHVWVGGILEGERPFRGGPLGRTVINGSMLYGHYGNYYGPFCKIRQKRFEYIFFAFLEAFKARVFSNLEMVRGITGALDGLRHGDKSLCCIEDPDRDDTATSDSEDEDNHEPPDTSDRGEGVCSFCKTILNNFPLIDLLRTIYTSDACGPRMYFCHCIDCIEVIEILSKRKNARKVFKEESSRMLCEYLESEMNYTFDDPYRYSKSEENENDQQYAKKLVAKLEEMGVLVRRASGRPLDVWYLSEYEKELLVRMIAAGFDPTQVQRNKLYRTLKIGRKHRRGDVIAISTFDFLSSQGFDLDAKDLLIIDEKEEPALKNIIGN